MISASIGGLGGFGANHYLRQTSSYLNVSVLPQLEAYISNVQTLFSRDGQLRNEGTRQFLKQYMQAYAE